MSADALLQGRQAFGPGRLVDLEGKPGRPFIPSSNTLEGAAERTARAAGTDLGDYELAQDGPPVFSRRTVTLSELWPGLDLTPRGSLCAAAGIHQGPQAAWVLLRWDDGGPVTGEEHRSQTHATSAARTCGARLATPAEYARMLRANRSCPNPVIRAGMTPPTDTDQLEIEADLARESAEHTAQNFAEFQELLSQPGLLRKAIVAATKPKFVYAAVWRATPDGPRLPVLEAGVHTLTTAKGPFPSAKGLYSGLETAEYAHPTLHEPIRLLYLTAQRASDDELAALMQHVRPDWERKDVLTKAQQQKAALAAKEILI